MDPETNHGGEASTSGDDTTAIAAVPVEPTPRDESSSTEVSLPDTASAAVETPVQAPQPVQAAPAPAKKKKSRTRPKAGTHPNNVRKLRQGAMMSKAELSRRAGVSPLTIDRVEAGCPCRMDTKRKILEALGLEPSAAKQVFPDLETP